MNLQELNAIRAQVIEKAEKPFEKARGKTAFLGEVRIMGGKKWVKTANGWVYQNKNGTHTHYNSATKETERASDEHVIHYTKSVNKDADKSIESHAKGDLPKSEVDKHFKDDGKLSESATRLLKSMKAAGTLPIKNTKYDEQPEYTKELIDKGLLKIDVKHRNLVYVEKEQLKTEDKPKEKVDGLTLEEHIRDRNDLAKRQASSSREDKERYESGIIKHQKAIEKLSKKEKLGSLDKLNEIRDKVASKIPMSEQRELAKKQGLFWSKSSKSFYSSSGKDMEAVKDEKGKIFFRNK